MLDEWEVEKTGKKIKDDTVFLTVEYRKNKITVKTEVFTSNQAQPEDWPIEGIQRTLKALQEVPLFYENLGLGVIDILSIRG